LKTAVAPVPANPHVLPSGSLMLVAACAVGVAVAVAVGVEVGCSGTDVAVGVAGASVAVGLGTPTVGVLVAAWATVCAESAKAVGTAMALIRSQPTSTAQR
jgi:hypothetical protein